MVAFKLLSRRPESSRQELDLLLGRGVPGDTINHGRYQDSLSPEMNEEIGIPNAGADGAGKAASELLPLVYEELRKLAAYNWLTKRPARRFSLLPWSMKPGCAWQGKR